MATQIDCREPLDTEEVRPALKPASGWSSSRPAEPLVFPPVEEDAPVITGIINGLPTALLAWAVTLMVVWGAMAVAHLL